MLNSPKLITGIQYESNSKRIISESKTVVAMEPFTISQLKEILGVDRIAGTPEQIEIFGIRVAELAALNGRDWVRKNATQLLNQWHCAIRQRANCKDSSR
jgi:hypothetical protein